MTHRIGKPSSAAVRAIAHLRNARDDIELALRPPGERVTISRQDAEAILNDLGAAACSIRELAEGAS